MLQSNEGVHDLGQLNKRYFVLIHHVLHNELEIDAWEVTDFNVTYDTTGVLTVENIVGDDPSTAFYGPGTWKFVGIHTEDVKDEQEEKEE